MKPSAGTSWFAVYSGGVWQRAQPLAANSCCPLLARSSNRLGFREFVMRDVDGRVQKVRVDVSYVDGLLEHLDTTPAAIKAAPAPVPVPAADLEG